jgi:hypothetical protein
MGSTRAETWQTILAPGIQPNTFIFTVYICEMNKRVSGSIRRWDLATIFSL